MKQFYLNIKYMKGITNHIVVCLSQPPIVVLTIVLNSCGHETFGWQHLYNSDYEFAATH